MAATAALWQGVELIDAARLDGTVALTRLGSSAGGLAADEAERRLKVAGPNALGRHGARPIAVLTRQFANPLLLLLAAAAITSVTLRQNTDAVIILFIVALSVGLGFFNEYRSEKAVEDLRAHIRHTAIVMRDGHAVRADVTMLVPGDVVLLDVGDVVPADLRLLESRGIECDESVLTGESMPAEKSVEPVTESASGLNLASCAFMGTVVRSGNGRGAVVKTGSATAFGRIAAHLGERLPETAFQHGLRDFSKLLVRITVVLTVSIFILNALLHHPFLESLLFALAIAVGLTPQLLPAIVTISLATGARHMARKSVIVKRLVGIEDLGNVEVLFTDKTGTLTEGKIAFAGAFDETGAPSTEVARLGLLCNSAVVEDGTPVGGNALDMALWAAPAATQTSIDGYTRVAEAPFDYQRRRMSVIVTDGSGRRTLIVKGAPESVLTCCGDLPESFRRLLDAQFAAGARAVAVATRAADGVATLSPGDERGLRIAGLLTFVDPIKAQVSDSLARLSRLGIELKIATGDNEQVAQKVCGDVGVRVTGTLTGNEIDALGDEQLLAALPKTTIFARLTPEQKSRLIKLQRSLGVDVGFLGDGVNDAVALHDADVGISVDSAVDVAKDAADIVLLDKDLGILADGVVEGRQVFANTIKYVLMGTSSNFGNMFSAAGASLFLPFLPMLPSQILLNNLLYDGSEMTIPTDNVDDELLRRPAHWDMRFIRRFMLLFGPISSIFDFATFAIMLWLLHAGERLFQSGWFVESLLTQTLVIFAIRTRRVPLWRSRPSAPLAVTTVACVAVGAWLPFSPLASLFGFVALPIPFLAALAAMIVTYIGLVELGKAWFFKVAIERPTRLAPERASRKRRRRVAARFRTRRSFSIHS